MTTNLAAADLLDRAAKHLDDYGWTQGAYSDGDRSCAMGALMLESEGFWSAEMVAREALRAAIGCTAIAGWNDAPGRSGSEVTAAMRQAAAELRKGQ